MESSRYHKFLRVSAVIFAFILLFDSGFINPITKELSNTTLSYLASVGTGMSASVPPNEINELTAQIAEQQRELNAREAALNEREIAARSFTGDSQDYSVYILSIILFILTVLIVLNYIMDWVRSRNQQYEGATT